MNKALFCFLVCSTAAFSQTSIPAGTILAAQLNSSLSSGKSKPGQTITARIMQDVPLPAGKKIPAGAKLIGRAVTAHNAQSNSPAEISIVFDTLKFRHQSLKLKTNLRAMASMLEVEDAQTPSTGPDRGTPAAWTTRNLIGGEVAYGEDGPVADGDQTVGHALMNGVLVPVRPNGAAGCRGAVNDNNQPQALWIFSSTSCGVYGLDDLQIKHAGRTEPIGEITLSSSRPKLDMRAGSGLLLRVISSKSE